MIYNILFKYLEIFLLIIFWIFIHYYSNNVLLVWGITTIYILFIFLKWIFEQIDNEDIWYAILFKTEGFLLLMFLILINNHINNILLILFSIIFLLFIFLKWLLWFIIEYDNRKIDNKYYQFSIFIWILWFLNILYISNNSSMFLFWIIAIFLYIVSNTYPLNGRKTI